MPVVVGSQGQRDAAHRWWPVGVATTAIWTVSMLPGDAAVVVPGYDLIGHTAEFAVLGWLTARASGARSRALTAILVGLVVGVGTELSQLAAVERSAEVADLAADLLGAALGAGAWALARPRPSTR